MKQDSLSLACAIIMAIAASIGIYIDIYDQVEDTLQVVNDNEELVQPIQNQSNYKIIFIDNRHSIFECNNPQNFDVLEKIFFDKCVIKK